jgi:alpha-1,3/alpha-1,6-mannosyltransferase
MADRVLVNSRFTAECFRRAFPRLGTVEPEVLYPSVDLTRYNQVARENIDSTAVSNERIILSINRYESKKNLGLAVKALACLRDRLPGDIYSRVKLIIAGGYDERLRENRATLTELEALARQLQVEKKVLFLRSISEKERVALLSRCSCVLYTPTDEHFGYGPLEAMAACRPVIAVNRGGPVETLLQGDTGLLCPPHPQAFADALARLLRDPREVERMGRAGRTHVEKNFSRSAFSTRLEAILWDVIAKDTRKTQQNP